MFICSDGEQINGTLQKSYIEEAAKQRQAASKKSVYDKAYSGTESPPLLTSFEQRTRKDSLSVNALY